MTLDQDHLRSTTTSRADASFTKDRLWLNGKEEEIKEGGRTATCIAEMKRLRADVEKKDFESAPTGTGTLPDAPPWPCPVLNDSEIITYLPSLFSKRWGLTRNEKDMPILACKYRIKGYDRILNFVQSVGKIAQEEDVS